MAVTQTSYYANAIVGVPQAGADIKIQEVHNTPRYAVGFGFERSDGNKYRYVQYGAATETAQLVSTDISETGLASISAANKVINSSSAIAVSFEKALPGDVGSHYFEASLTGTANQFAGAYLSIYGGTGEGYTYRIKGNTATDDPASGNLRIQLYEPLVLALDATSDLVIVGNRWCDVEASTTTTDYCASGICQYGASSSQYGWVLTKGVGTVRGEGNAIAKGNAITTGGVAGTAMAVPNLSTNPTLLQVIGYAMVDKVAAQTHAQVYINVD